MQAAGVFFGLTKAEGEAGQKLAADENKFLPAFEWFVGNAAVYQNQGNVVAFDAGKHGRPEIGFKPKNEVGFPVVQKMCGERGIVNGQILMKSPFGKTFGHDIGRGAGAGGDHDADIRINFKQALDEREHGNRLADGSAVKPDEFSLRAFLLRTAEAFVEAADVFFADCFAMLDIGGDDQWIENTKQRVVDIDKHLFFSVDGGFMSFLLK